MSLPRWARHTVTVLSPGTVTVFGAEEDSWAPEDVQEREIQGCWCWPATTEEIRDRGRDTTVTAYNVNLPPAETKPAAHDRLRLPDGEVYEVIGEVKDMPSATGRLDYQTLYAERFENRG